MAKSTLGKGIAMTSKSAAKITECAGADALARPSTVRRRSNLRRIIVTFVGTPFDAPAIASLLQCSLSAAYQYIDMLVDASVIKSFHGVEGSGENLRKGYRLNSDPLYASTFLARLQEPPPMRLPAKRQDILRDYAGPEYRHAQVSRPMREKQTSSVHPPSPAKRDPLVAALFGARGAAPSLVDCAGRTS